MLKEAKAGCPQGCSASTLGERGFFASPRLLNTLSLPSARRDPISETSLSSQSHALNYEIQQCQIQAYYVSASYNWGLDKPLFANTLVRCLLHEKPSLSQFHRWENCGSEKLSDLSKVTQQVIKSSWVQNFVLNNWAKWLSDDFLRLFTFSGSDSASEL